MHRLIFVAGVPATGKTWLGNWLAEAPRQFIHINLEKDDAIDLDILEVRQQWNAIVATGRAEEFIAGLRQVDKSVVITWGFPLQLLYVVRALSVAGMELWWIRGDRRHAKTAYVQRYLRGAGPHPANFDPQMDQIERNWSLLTLVFGNHFIEGLSPNGTQRKPAEIWADMAGV